jgi:formate--tetrahydrofolate ligase
MMALLADAIEPNLVQTTEGAPALVHAGPFGNIAHGTSSIIAQQIGLRLADYVVNEVGFAADLGAEKYLDIVMGVSGTTPSAAVLVTTVQSLRNQGEGDLMKGFPNLARHVQNLQRFGLPTVVAINRFLHDTRDQDLDQLRAFCDTLGVPTALTEPFTKGGEGSEALARAVVDLIDRNPGAAAHPIYALSDSYEDKIRQSRHANLRRRWRDPQRYRRAKLRQFVDWGYAELPICIAKTQYSFTDDPKTPRRAHRLDPDHQRRLALRRRRVPGRDRRQHDAHARPAQSPAR